MMYFGRWGLPLARLEYLGYWKNTASFPPGSPCSKGRRLAPSLRIFRQSWIGLDSTGKLTYRAAQSRGSQDTVAEQKNLELVLVLERFPKQTFSHTIVQDF